MPFKDGTGPIGHDYGHGFRMYCGCGPRGFLTKEEKIKMLQEYKEMLEKEAKGVSERIKELEKN